MSNRSHTFRTGSCTMIFSLSIVMPTPDAWATSNRPPHTPPPVASCMEVTPFSRPPTSTAVRASSTTDICQKISSASRATFSPYRSATRWGKVTANRPAASMAAPLVMRTVSPGRPRHRKGEIKVQGDVGRPDPGGGRIGSEDVDGEPGGTFPSVGGDDEDRIGRGHHHLSVAQIDDPHIHPMLGTHQDFRTLPAQSGEDDLIEDFRGYLADGGHLRFHVILLSNRQKRGTGRHVPAPP